MPYLPSSEAPILERFMRDISSGLGTPDDDWVDYVQRAIGYSMSGRVGDEVMLFLLGVGANGKSVLCNVWRRVFGTYATSVPANFLMVSKQRDGEGATPSLASLAGARLALANEVEAGSRLSAQMVKVATSTDEIAARNLYGGKFTFTPTHTPCVRGNHKPIIADNDPGKWRRVHLVPFDRHFTAEEKDIGLEEKIMRETPGVLVWMVRGHMAYLAHGLHPARRVAAASAAYRAESDLIGQWIEDRGISEAGSSWVTAFQFRDQAAPLRRLLRSGCGRSLHEVGRLLSARSGLAARRVGMTGSN